jgi:hypothetical protein
LLGADRSPLKVFAILSGQTLLDLVVVCYRLGFESLRLGVVDIARMGAANTEQWRAPMAKRELEKIIGHIEDAKTSVEEAREEHNEQERDEQLEEAQDTLEKATDDLEEEINADD